LFPGFANHLDIANDQLQDSPRIAQSCARSGQGRSILRRSTTVPARGIRITSPRPRAIATTVVTHDRRDLRANQNIQYARKLELNYRNDISGEKHGNILTNFCLSAFRAGIRARKQSKSNEPQKLLTCPILQSALASNSAGGDRNCRMGILGQSHLYESNACIILGFPQTAFLALATLF
jgi:plasmid stabilization system protein ParE